MRGMLIYTNLITAVSAGILSAGILHASAVTDDYLYPFFVLSAVLTVYNAQRLYKALFSDHQTDWLEWVRKYSCQMRLVTSFFALVCFVIGLYCIPFSIDNAIILLFGALLCTFYVMPISGFTLRQIPVLKNVIVAMVWTMILVIVPLNNSAPTEQIALFVLYFFSLTLPFDIRDIHLDKNHIVTLPHLLGANSTRALGVVCISIFYVLFPLINSEYLSNIAYWLSGVFAAAMILSSSPKRTNIYLSLNDLSMSLFGVALMAQ
jgi:hypothetical protein